VSRALGSKQSCKNLAIVTLLVLLVGCASKPPVNPNDGRYSIEQDRAPDSVLDIGAIPEVVPEPIVRTLAGNRSPYSVLGKSYTVMDTEEGYTERGVASWYGEKFHGHRTSNGEVFDMYSASAAHKSLPIPSFLQVTNLDNNRSIIVRVNDRGPFHGDRIVDLSYAAAMKLGYANRGTARVQLEAIMPPTSSRETRTVPSTATNVPMRSPIAMEGKQYIQVGAFSDQEAAQRLSGQLREITSLPVFIQEVITSSSQKLHRVRVGPIINGSDIRNVTERVVAANLGSPYTVTE
jgi:rare lipoprotein A